MATITTIGIQQEEINEDCTEKVEIDFEQTLLIIDREGDDDFAL